MIEAKNGRMGAMVFREEYAESESWLRDEEGRKGRVTHVSSRSEPKRRSVMGRSDKRPLPTVV